MTGVEDSDRFSQAADVVACNLDGGKALLDMATSNYYQLNGTAAMLWELIGDGMRVADIADHMFEQFEVERSQCLADAKRVIGAFLEADLVLRVD